MNRPITIAICLFIILALGIGVIWPRYQTLKSTQLKIEEKSFELQNRKDYYGELARISGELKKYSGELSKIDSALPSSLSLPSLFNFLQKAASGSGLVFKKVGQLSLIPPEENQRIKEYRVDISLSGSYLSFEKFLLELEKSARIIEVEKIAFSYEGKDLPFTFDLTIKFHSY